MIYLCCATVPVLIQSLSENEKGSMALADELNFYSLGGVVSLASLAQLALLQLTPGQLYCGLLNDPGSIGSE